MRNQYILTMLNNKLESFDVNKAVEGLDKRYLVKIIAKTSGVTDHTKDFTLPANERVKRIYTIEELAAGARTLSLRPININHKIPINGAFVVYATMVNDKVEALCYIPSEEYINKIKSGIVKEVSIEEVNFDEIVTIEGNKLEDIVFTGLALVEGSSMVAGDSNTSIQPLFEGLNVLCEIVGVEDLEPKKEIVDQNEQGEWCVYHCHNGEKGEVIKCFPTKEQADEMHRAIMANKGEGLPTKIESTLPDDKDKKLQEAETKITEKENRIKELEGSVGSLITTVQILKTEQSTKVSEAVKETKENITKKIEAVLPTVIIQRQAQSGMVILTQNIKKVIKEIKEE